MNNKKKLILFWVVGVGNANPSFPTPKPSYRFFNPEKNIDDLRSALNTPKAFRKKNSTQWDRQWEQAKSYEETPFMLNTAHSRLLTLSGTSNKLLKKRIEEKKKETQTSVEMPSFLKSYVNKSINYFKSFFVKPKTVEEMEIEKNINLIAKNKLIDLTLAEKNYIKNTILKNSAQSSESIKKEDLYPTIYATDFEPQNIDRTVDLSRETLAQRPKIQELLERHIENYENPSIRSKKQEDLLKIINKKLKNLNDNLDSIVKTYINKKKKEEISNLINTITIFVNGRVKQELKEENIKKPINIDAFNSYFETTIEDLPKEDQDKVAILFKKYIISPIKNTDKGQLKNIAENGLEEFKENVMRTLLNESFEKSD